MSRHWIFISGLCLTSCLGNNGLWTMGSSEQNIFNLSLIQEGMTEAEVLRVMHKPYDYKTICINDDIYDVWFYVTRPTALGQTRMVHQNLTPLTFKNGILIGWGYVFYNGILQEKEQVAAPQPPPQKSQEEENKELEKALETPPSNNPPPPPGSPPGTNLPGRSPEQDNPQLYRNQPPPPAKQGQQPPKTAPGNKTAPAKPGQQKKSISMAKSSDDSDTPAPTQKNPPKEAEPFDDEGNRRLEDESEQDFDFW